MFLMLLVLYTVTLPRESCGYVPMMSCRRASWMSRTARLPSLTSQMQPKTTSLSFQGSSDEITRRSNHDNLNDSITTRQGVLHLANEQQHRNLLQSHRDNLIVIKYYSVSCKACKALEPKFRKLAKDHGNNSNNHVPIVFAQIPLTQNAEFFDTVLHLHALPSIQIYSGDALLDSFACPPKLHPSLMERVTHWIERQMMNHPFVMNDHHPQHLTWRNILIPPTTTITTANNEKANHNNSNKYYSSGMGSATANENNEVDYPDIFPRNNRIPSPPRSDEFFAVTDHDDIPLQLSDIFLIDDD